MSTEPDDGEGVCDWHRVAAGPFPAPWREILLERVPFYKDLSDAERERFERQVHVFVVSKAFSAAAGLTLTDEMKVVVAAAACRLTINMPWEHYAQVKYIGLRAEAFRGHQGLTAIGQGSRWQVTLSWPDLVHAMAVPDDGHNVGYHEFAHALDGADDTMDGEASSPASEMYANWTEVISTGRAEVQRALEAKVAPPIDGYAATDDCEFFAVATEWFFERPRALRERMPAVHDLLSRFYRQDPPLEKVKAPEPAAVAHAEQDLAEAFGSAQAGATVAESIPQAAATGSEAKPWIWKPRPRRDPVRIADPPEWTAREIIRLIGWTCILIALVMVLPCGGAESGASHEPGLDSVTALSFTRGVGLAGLTLGAAGLVALVVAWLVPDRPDDGREG